MACLLLTGCSGPRWTGTFEYAALGQNADLASTICCLEMGAEEMNPLMEDASDAATVKLAVILVTWVINENFPENAETMNRVVGTIGFVFTGWNVVQMVRY